MSLVDAANVSVAAAPWIPTATLSGTLSSRWEMLTLVSGNTAKVAACDQPCHVLAVPHVEVQAGNMLTYGQHWKALRSCLQLLLLLQLL